MSALTDTEQRLDDIVLGSGTDADELLRLGESVLEQWVLAKGEEPTSDTREGFRLLGLHRQGAAGDPSFNACRETCRELVYHHNLMNTAGADPDVRSRHLTMMGLVANHLCLFVSGKLSEHQLGDFCCSSKPIRHRQPLESTTETNDA